MEIIYKDIIGYEGLYKIGSNGDIIRYPRLKIANGGRSIMLPEKKLDFCCDGNYYPRVVLIKDRKSKTFAMHRLMAVHFIPNDNPMRREVNHKNKNILDFSIENLEWCTRSENMKHAKNDEYLIQEPKIEQIKVRKNIDLTCDCIETITIEGLKKKPKKVTFKEFAQYILEDFAKKLKQTKTK